MIYICYMTRVPFLIFIILFYCLSCNSIPVKNTDAATTELDEAVKDLYDSYSRKVEIDTSIPGNIHIVFSNYCLHDSSLIIPGKFVSMYGMKELVTHTFQSSLKIQPNNIKTVDTLINKSFFDLSKLETLNKYGVLSYDHINISDDHLDVLYTIGVPLTDLGANVVLHCYYSGELKGQVLQ